LEKKIRQLEKRLDEKDQQIEDLKETTTKEIEELKKKPSIVNQVLQVVCVTNNDNYLDMLNEQLNSFDKAIQYIAECALSSINGDCKLIEKIYLNNSTPSISYIDKNRTKLVFFDENQKKIIDLKGIQLRKRLANNLQNSYLKGINHLINDNLNNKLCPNKLLQEYDLQIWNQHIYDLSDDRYQRKIIDRLDIPRYNPVWSESEICF
jgi:hypothetical protein